MILSRRKQSKKSSGHEYRALHLIIILLICFTILSGVILKNQDEISDFPSENESISPLKGNPKEGSLENSKPFPTFDIQSSQNPHILFIVADPTSLDPSYDKPFVDFINKTLGFNVTLHDDNNSFSLTGYDAVVISDSALAGDVSSLANESIPILIMESFTHSIFRLASGRGSGWGSDFYVINSSHYITLNETIDTSVSVYTAENDINFMKGFGAEPSWSEIDDLSQRLGHKDNERTIIALDKGKKDWDNVSAAERRTFWGATHGDLLNQKGWELWNRTLRWILYDDINGSATINVNVIDLDNQNVPNAEVNLTDYFDATKKYSQNTSVAGLTTFTNIPYGSYNLSVEFEDSVNDTLVFLNITGQQTFNLTADFNYLVRINEYVDNDPPSITNVGFFSSNRTFHADVSDTSTLVTVNLSLSASNATFTRNQNYTMVTLNGILYFNESAAQDLTAVNVTYNITAIDIAGNIRISDNYSFLLGDITPPIIWEYNVTDYENGTLEFYANITDKQSDVQDPVILRINDSYVQMHLNASGYWTYRTLAYYDLTLNYTIWSANDSIGNENGTRKYVLTPEFGLIFPKDNIMPHIWGVSDTFAVHEDGHVEFTSSVDDWNEFQSGVNITSIQLTLSVNGINTSYIMTPIGATTYYYEYTFNYLDTVYYWVNASDLAGNINPGFEHGPFVIDDNAIPTVSWWAEEWGNGTVDFYAEVIDWPNNETIANVSYTQNWFDTPWPNKPMMKITESQFSIRVYEEDGQEFQLEDIFFYVTAIDASNNSNEPTVDQSLSIMVTDKVPPVITFTIENSTEIDGEITVTAYAIDVFSVSNFVNNTFYINMTSKSTTIETTMNYDPILRNWYKTQDFPYGEEVDIAVGVHDDAGNFGKNNKTIVIDDFAPPNINRHDSIVYQNGTVLIWAEVFEGPFGSGLAEDNTSVTIEIIYRSSKNVTMIWNGSGNFYTYSISGFVPTDVPMYRIKAVDKNLNPNITEFTPIYIFDETSPICHDHSLIEMPINHYSSSFRFWVNASDPFGTLAGVNLTVNYYNTTYSWINNFEMQYDGSLYVIVIQQVILDRSFNYSIVLYDEALNTLQVRNSTLTKLNFRSTELRDHGIELYEENIGKVRFWCETHDVFDDHNVTLTVLDDTNGSSYERRMEHNGTHYGYNVSIDYLHYYSYIIEVTDSGVIGGYYNPIQGSNSHQMQDIWAPERHGSDFDHNLLNCYSTNYTFWVNTSDPFGTIAEVNISITYRSSLESWINQSEMQYNGSFYVYSIEMINNGTFNYTIFIHDGANNKYFIEPVVQNTPDFQTPKILESGLDFNKSNPGEVIFWANISKVCFDFNVTISVTDETEGKLIINNTLMSSNGSHYIYSVSLIPYNHFYDYTIKTSDKGTLKDYYDPDFSSSSDQMSDPWRPVIVEPIIDIDNGTVTVRVNITDWGSGVSNATLFYQFVSGSNGGGGSQTFNSILMDNESIQSFYAILKFNKTGILSWYIQAYDEKGYTSTDVNENGIAVILPTPPLNPFLIVLIVILTAAFLIILLLVGRTIQRGRSVKYRRIREMEEKLSIISNVYTLLVSTEVGVPIYTITNVMYQKDKTLSDMLSGLSVGIDTFLQSFQSDFLQQVQQQDFEVSETESGISIRMSVIEQHQVQVLIAATQMFRIFVFLRELPSIFTRDAISRSIEELEKNITIRDLGIVDERVYGPQVEQILQKFLPLTLLEPFVIDTIKLKRLDEGLKRGRSDIPISRPSINSLKRLVVTHTLSKGKETNIDKIFNEAVSNGSLLESRMLLYNEAKEIMTKLLKIPLQQVYEALWVGCAPEIKIIIPQRV